MKNHLPPSAAGLYALQERVIDSLDGRPWLRNNSLDVLEDCIDNHVVLAAREGTELVGAGILYDPTEPAESIAGYLAGASDIAAGAINLKAVYVAPEHRGKHLATHLVEQLHEAALRLGRTHALCTIHPDNAPSRRLFESLGYVPQVAVHTSYGERIVYAKVLEALETLAA